MSTLNVNLTDTPDQIAKIQPGVRTFTINKVPEIKPPKQPKPGSNMVVIHIELTIDEEGKEDHGRNLMTWITYDPAAGEKQPGATNLKRLFLACGLPIDPAGVDLTKLVGRKLRGSVATGTFTQDGVTKETVRFDDYIIPNAA